MKAIILAAGRGTRLKPITDTTPKPLIQIRGKSILENLLEQLVNDVNEFILIVDYKREMFIETFWDNYCGVPITYKNQGEKKWTGAAIEWITTDEDVIVLYSDAIFSQKDIQKLVTHNGYGCLVQEVEHPEKYGIFSQDTAGNAIEVVEKPQEYVGNLANLWAYKFSSEILSLVQKLTPSPRGEYELTDAINVFCKNNPFKLFPIEWYFLDVSYTQDIDRVEKYLQTEAKKNLLHKPIFGESIYLDTLKNFEVHLGISQKHISELIEYSQDASDEALQKNTSDKTRFFEIKKIETWYNDTDRYIFTLVSKDGRLAGIWWARPCKTPEVREVLDTEAYTSLQNNIENLHTNGIRIYPEFRWIRIATPWVNICSLYYKDIFPNLMMSVDVEEENIPMQKGLERASYRKVGYGENINSADNTGKKRFVYIQENS